MIQKTFLKNEFYGVQVGVGNVTKEMNGVQVGVVNGTNEMNGVQVESVCNKRNGWSSGWSC